MFKCSRTLPLPVLTLQRLAAAGLLTWLGLFLPLPASFAECISGGEESVFTTCHLSALEGCKDTYPAGSFAIILVQSFLFRSSKPNSFVCLAVSGFLWQLNVGCHRSCCFCVFLLLLVFVVYTPAVQAISQPCLLHFRVVNVGIPVFFCVCVFFFLLSATVNKWE